MGNDTLPTPDDIAAAAPAGSDAREPVAMGSIAGRAEASISAELLQLLIDAARDSLPNESCGLLVSHAYASEGGAPERYLPLANAAESPYRYLIDPQEQLRAWLDLEDAGEVPWAIVHSHVASAAVPSATDVGLAFFPDSLYVICSLADEMPSVRAWSIVEGAVGEVPLSVTE